MEHRLREFKAIGAGRLTGMRVRIESSGATGVLTELRNGLTVRWVAGHAQPVVYRS